MGRIVKSTSHVPEGNPSEVALAPHRYRWDGTLRPDGERAKELAECESYTERRANIPYRVGEVVLVEMGDRFCRALIYAVLTESDRWGEPREFYKVQRETVKGTWSGQWEKAYPGFIQRGYQRAGLAPEIPEDKKAGE